MLWMFRIELFYCRLQLRYTTGPGVGNMWPFGCKKLTVALLQFNFVASWHTFNGITKSVRRVVTGWTIRVYQPNRGKHFSFYHQLSLNLGPTLSCLSVWSWPLFPGRIVTETSFTVGGSPGSIWIGRLRNKLQVADKPICSFNELWVVAWRLQTPVQSVDRQYFVENCPKRN